jgi:hypothetical protein
MAAVGRDQRSSPMVVFRAENENEGEIIEVKVNASCTDVREPALQIS